MQMAQIVRKAEERAPAKSSSIVVQAGALTKRFDGMMIREPK
jgi:hypothetical protein